VRPMGDIASTTGRSTDARANRSSDRSDLPLSARSADAKPAQSLDGGLDGTLESG
jgi:hypothetical protein